MRRQAVKVLPVRRGVDDLECVRRGLGHVALMLVRHHRPRTTKRLGER